jgi:hypothetical protein
VQPVKKLTVDELPLKYTAGAAVNFSSGAVYFLVNSNPVKPLLSAAVNFCESGPCSPSSTL